ncbi:MAG: serine/threonine-protein phosphatase [Ktedonobacteraceae bacterium]|nr:serine/threonine-protein phosphatase [Ktedonobacteraceae bacterium]
MHLKITAADKTDVGKQREQNEDCAYKRVESSEEGDKGLFIVADGMGGYKAGEVASKLAIETISKALDSFFKPLPDQPTIRLDRAATLKMQPVRKGDASGQKTRKLDETPEVADIEERLKTAIQQANAAIVRHGEKNPVARGLGSTVTAMLLHDQQAYIANVGDSRTYLLRDKQLTALTHDHSLVAKLVETGQIDPEDVYTHPQRNLIYRSLGAGHKSIEVDVFHETVQPGDTFLLCSDGLWEMVHQQDLLRELSEPASPQKICDTLIELANQNGGEDNISAIVVHVSAV